MSVNVRQALRTVIDDRRDRIVNCQAGLLGVETLTETHARITLTGEGLRGYTDPHPGDAFKLYLPARAGDDVPAPNYDENGRVRWSIEPTIRQPLVRCFTVRDCDPDRGELAFDALLHPRGATAQWLTKAAPGQQLGLTGMRTEFVDTESSRTHLLIGDDSALPAIVAIAEGIPADKRIVIVTVGAAGDIGRLGELPPTAHVTAAAANPHAVLEAVARTEILGPDCQVWIGAEAGCVRAVRRGLLDQCGLTRNSLHASAYWKRGLDWEQTFEESLTRFTAAAASGADVTDPGVLQSLAFDQGTSD